MVAKYRYVTRPPSPKQPPNLRTGVVTFDDYFANTPLGGVMATLEVQLHNDYIPKYWMSEEYLENEARARAMQENPEAFADEQATGAEAEFGADLVNPLVQLFDSAVNKVTGEHVNASSWLSTEELRVCFDKDKLTRLLREANVLYLFDEDGDGRLSMSEMLATMDLDNDGNVTLEEFLTAVFFALTIKAESGDPTEPVEPPPEDPTDLLATKVSTTTKPREVKTTALADLGTTSGVGGLNKLKPLPPIGSPGQPPLAVTVSPQDLALDYTGDVGAELVQQLKIRNGGSKPVRLRVVDPPPGVSVSHTPGPVAPGMEMELEVTVASDAHTLKTLAEGPQALRIMTSSGTVVVPLSLIV
jgi:hypothetical protein